MIKLQESFLIIDGTSLICRAGYVKSNDDPKELVNSAGVVTGGIFRFLNLLNRALKLIQPTHLVICWDVDRNTWRRKLYPPYKMNREGAVSNHPDNTIQRRYLNDLLNAVGIITIAIPGYEGDDLVGTCSNQSNAEVDYILTGDNDLLQLVGDNVKLVALGSPNIENLTIRDEKYVLDKYNVSVKQFLDYKTLKGDSGDNVPGINGCGDVRAQKLIERFSNVENVINCDDVTLESKVPEKALRNGIIEWKPNALLYKRLLAIDVNVKLPYSYSDFKLNLNWNNDQALKILNELEFNSIIKRIERGDFYNGQTYRW